MIAEAGEYGALDGVPQGESLPSPFPEGVR